MWMSGMRGVPPLIDIVATVVAASTRNNGPRRFFQPILIDRYGDRGSLKATAVTEVSTIRTGMVAQIRRSLDSTRVVYWQAIITSPACGGSNLLTCPVSTAPGGRVYRAMLARLTSRSPTPPAPVYQVPDQIPWATSFPPGAKYPSLPTLKPRNYTLQGNVSGCAEVKLNGNDNKVGEYAIKRVAVNYTNYSEDGQHILNGWEDVELTVLYPNVWNQKLDWYSDIVQTGAVNATKKTSSEGLHLSMDVMKNILEANGTLKTTIDRVE
jgi:hypothetical protein